MTTILNQFIVDIYHNDKLFTVQQVIEFLNQTTEKCPGDDKVSALASETKMHLAKLMNSYGLSPYSILKKSNSPAGKAITRLAYEHANEVIKNRNLK